MITQFEVGKFYRWIGPKDFNTSWNVYMDAWKDGIQRKCLSVNGSRAIFSGISSPTFIGWSYDHVYSYFMEVPGVEQGQYLLEL